MTRARHRHRRWQYSTNARLSIVRSTASTLPAGTTFGRTNTPTVTGNGFLGQYSNVPVWLNHPALPRENRSESPVVEPQKSTPATNPAEAEEYHGLDRRQAQAPVMLFCCCPRSLGQGFSRTLVHPGGG